MIWKCSGLTRCKQPAARREQTHAGLHPTQQCFVLPCVQARTAHITQPNKQILCTDKKQTRGTGGSWNHICTLNIWKLYRVLWSNPTMLYWQSKTTIVFKREQPYFDLNPKPLNSWTSHPAVLHDACHMFGLRGSKSVRFFRNQDVYRDYKV